MTVVGPGNTMSKYWEKKKLDEVKLKTVQNGWNTQFKE